ncbi:uncharacterized protein LOC117063370 [Trachypithecus francoisi]|uniref:uncharacterized protein LOC117063370 n=1 Tax=Trachypithecus francoisi TaxID=54180 RepID=UPI00141BC822|nr:uncharacterized protein LOC117063370 [Trachypithecus francoisi]
MAVEQSLPERPGMKHCRPSHWQFDLRNHRGYKSKNPKVLVSGYQSPKRTPIVEIPRLKDVDLVLHQAAELAVWGDPARIGQCPRTLLFTGEKCDPLTLTNLHADRTPAEPLWAAHPAFSAQAARPNSTFYPKPTTLAHTRSSLESATCARVLLLALQPARRLQGRRSNYAVPLSVPRLLVEQSGPRRRWRERAASAPPKRGQRDRGLRAPPLLHRFSKRDARSILLPSVYGFPGAQNFASVPTSISRPLSPSPRDSPTPWARAHPYTHTRRRACARPRASSRGVSSAPQQIHALPGAATHTGFQPPRGVLCLLQRRRRRRERRLQPGRVSQLRARDTVREKQRRRRTPRLGGAAPRPAPHSARRVASALHTAAPGKQLRGPQHPWGVRAPSLGPLVSPPPRHLDLDWEGSGRGGRGVELEVRLVRRSAWTRGGFGAALTLFPAVPRLKLRYFYELGGAQRPRQLFPDLPAVRQPVSALDSAPAARQSPPLHLGQRTPHPSPSAGVAPGTRSCPHSAPAALFFQGVTLPLCIPSPPALADSALLRAGNFPPRLVCAGYYCCYL